MASKCANGRDGGLRGRRRVEHPSGSESLRLRPDVYGILPQAEHLVSLKGPTAGNPYLGAEINRSSSIYA